MKKYLFALATLAIAVVACNKETDVQQPDKVGKRMITVIAETPETPETRTILDDQHNALLWAPGDNFRLMTNTGDSDANHDAQTLTYVENGRFEVEVSADADEAYAYYFAGDYTDANHSTPTAYTAYIERKQTQTKAGVLNGQMLPMAAKGTINADNTVSLSFHQMAGVLALNIYSTTKVAGEVINSVTVTPIGNTKFCGAMYGTNLTANNVLYTDGGSEDYSSVTVVLDAPYDYVSAKPDDKKMFDKQIYVVLGKQSYSSAKFEIKTNLGTYVITSNGSPLNLVDNDFYPVNINLARADYEEAGVAELDWTYPTSGAATSAGIQEQPGVTVEGLGNDYGENQTPYCIKFDSDDDYIQVRTDKAIGKVSAKYKMIGGNSASTLEIYESADGVSWTKVEDLSISGSQNSTGEVSSSVDFSDASRFVKINFKKGSNVGIGGITIERKTMWALSEIHVATAPTKTQYLVGQSFDPEGMVITADYVDANDDSRTREGILVTDYTYAPAGALTLSDNQITISYTEDEVTKTTTQAIVVSEVPAGTWVETALSDLTSNDVFVIVGNNQYALPNDGGTSNPEVVGVTVSNGTLTGTIPANLTWNVSGNATDGYTFYPNGGSSSWLYCSTTAASGSNSNMKVGTGNRKLFKLNPNNYLVTADDYTDRYLSIYNDQDWRGYTTTSNAAQIKFYRYSGTFVTVATPSFSVAEGTYTSSQSVEISCATSGATIYYTLDGSTPDNTKSVYSGALTISSTTTVKAIAIKDGAVSAIASATYTITGGGTETKTLEFTVASHTGWDVSEAEAKNGYYILYFGKSITSPSVSVSTIKSIVIKMRTFGSADANKVKIFYGNTEVGTATATSNSLTNITAVLTTTTVSGGPATFRIEGAAGNATSKGEGIAEITINYN